MPNNPTYAGRNLPAEERFVLVSLIYERPDEGVLDRQTGRVYPFRGSAVKMLRDMRAANGPGMYTPGIYSPREYKVIEASA